MLNFRELPPLYCQFILVCMLFYCYDSWWKGIYILSGLHQIYLAIFPHHSWFWDLRVFTSVPLTPSRFVEPDPSHTLEERVVHWHFAQLDNNGSHDINKKELTPFKRYLKKKAKPKKCARKFTDYCDLNKDRAISLQELKGCLGVSKEGKRTRKADGWEWVGRVIEKGHDPGMNLGPAGKICIWSPVSFDN